MGIPVVHFANPISSSAICSICTDVAFPPVQCPQGHLFCLQCIKSWCGSKGRHCPQDRADLDVKHLVPNRALEGLVLEMVVCCSYVAKDDPDLCAEPPPKKKQRTSKRVKIAPSPPPPTQKK
jgi:hypothetical protein